MKPETRRHEIVEVLAREGSATLDRLAERFAVSKMTIHRDLDDLAGEGRLRKVRGGATLEPGALSDVDFRTRARLATEEKRRIGAAAARLVEPGMTVMIDDGSTAQTVVPFLMERRPLSVITNNFAVIADLSGAAGVDLIALGGAFSQKFNGFFGVLTERALAGLRADVALVSTSAISGRAAFHQDQEVLEVKRLMIACAQRRYLLVDHRKFGRSAGHLLSDLSAFDAVITTDALPAHHAAALRAGGIGLRFAEGAGS